MPAPSAVIVHATRRRTRLHSAFAVLTICASVSTGAAALPVFVGAVPVGGAAVRRRWAGRDSPVW